MACVVKGAKKCLWRCEVLIRVVCDVFTRVLMPYKGTVVILMRTRVVVIDDILKFT